MSSHLRLLHYCHRVITIVIAAALCISCGGGSGNDSQNVTTSPVATPPVTSPPSSPVSETLYFPPNDSLTWSTTSPESLNWNQSAINELMSHLANDGTRAFIVLKDGRIIIEEYFGSTLNGGNNFDATRNWYWASAGKVLTGFTVGLAQQAAFLTIDESSAEYLGSGWAQLTSEQEQAITIKHHLSMTTGLDDSVIDSDCTLTSCLLFRNAPGERWAYHNAPYTLLTQIIDSAVTSDFETFFNNTLKQQIGMDGFWYSPDDSDNLTFYSTARSMARFGLLMLNRGDWNGQPILEDKAYFDQMITSSQTHNPAYGYLWWLNGKAAFMVPATGQELYDGSMTKSAPNDMYAALGKSGQFINVVPSQNLVIVRMGESTDDARVAVSVQNRIWAIFSKVLTSD